MSWYRLRRLAAVVVAGSCVIIAPATPAHAGPLPAVSALYPGAGMEILGDDPSICTAGFVAHNQRGAPVLFTAGHCDTGDTAAVNSAADGRLVPAANFVVSQYAGNAGNQTDVAVMSLTGALQLDPNIAGHLPVTGFASSVAEGMWLCKVGVATGRSCGRVVEASSSKVKFAADIAPGDSGGPVYGLKDDGTAFAVGITIRASSDDGYPVAELIGPWLDKWNLSLN